MNSGARAVRRAREYCSATPQGVSYTTSYLEWSRNIFFDPLSYSRHPASGLRELVLGALRVSDEDAKSLLMAHEPRENRSARLYTDRLYGAQQSDFREAIRSRKMDHCDAVQYIHGVDAICTLALFEAEEEISLPRGCSYRLESLNALSWVLCDASHSRDRHAQVLALGLNFAGVESAKVRTTCVCRDRF